MLRSLEVALLATLMGVALPTTAGAQQQTLGNPLTSPSNAQFGCETQPQLVEGGSYVLQPSGVPDCTWFNSLGGTVPGDGVVQRVTIKSGANPAQVRFVVLRTLSSRESGSFCCFFAGESAVFAPTPNTTQSFVVNLPVQRNTDPGNGVVVQDTVGVSAITGTGTLPLHDTGRHNFFDPIDPAANASWNYPRMSSANGGSGRRPEGSGNGWEVLLQTTFCPAGQTCDGGGGGGDLTAPAVLGRPAFGPNVFRVGPRATPVVARANRGSRLRFRLSEASTARIKIQKPVPGRRRRGACVRPEKAPRGAKRCKRWKTVGTLTRKGLPAGAAVVPFSGRIAKRALRPGRYRVAITARDTAGNASKVAVAGFTIVR